MPAQSTSTVSAFIVHTPTYTHLSRSFNRPRGGFGVFTGLLRLHVGPGLLIYASGFTMRTVDMMT